MLSRTTLLTGLALTGCVDPSLEIVFDVPPDYRDLITSRTLTVLEPADEDPFDCETLAFSEAETPSLGINAREFTSGLDETLSLNIPRRGRKLLWAAALDDTGPVVQACAELGELTEAVRLTLRGEPSTVLSFVDPTVTASVFGQPLPTFIDVLVTDARDVPMDGVRVRWDVIDGSGTPMSDEALSDGSGEIRVTPQATTHPGPHLLEIRSRWQRTEPAVLQGANPPLTQLDPPLDLDGAALQWRAGGVGPQGEPGLVVVLEAVTGQSVPIVLYVDPAMPLTVAPLTSCAPCPALEGARAVAVVDDGGNRDRVFTTETITAGAGQIDLVEVFADGTYRRNVAGTGSSSRVVSVDSVADCETPGPPLLVLGTEDFGYGCMDESATAVTCPWDSTMIFSELSRVANGCVRSVDGRAHRTLILRGDRDKDWVLSIISSINGWSVGAWDAHFEGVAVSTGGSALGVRRTTGGVELTRARMVPSSFGVQMETIETDALLARSISTVASDFDGDGETDVMAVIREAGAADHLLVIMGRRHRGRRLAAVFENLDITNAELVAFDFSGDGVDDLLIGERPPNTMGVKSKVRVMRWVP